MRERRVRVWLVGDGVCRPLRIILFFLISARVPVRPLVPLLKHRRDTTFTPALAPRAMPTAMSPTPAWSPEEEPESQEDEEKTKQGSKAAKAIPKSEGTMEGHSPTIVWIRHRRGLTRRRLNGDW